MLDGYTKQVALELQKFTGELKLRRLWWRFIKLNQYNKNINAFSGY
jgi:hypothetical protein